MRSGCSIEGCDKLVVTKGLCDMHRKRFQRYGSTEVVNRPKDWGKRRKHPLYESWRWLNRRKGVVEVDSSWDDFWIFVKDVGEKPGENYRLYKIKEELPYGPDNYHWAEVIPCNDRAAWMREYRKQNPAKFKDYELKRTFGISLGEYLEILEEQNGVCYICGEPPKKGSSLAVDHCHTSGKVRNLLCTYCNTGLGAFKDSIENLTKAIEYLKAHA